MTTVNKTQAVHVASEILAFLSLTFYINQKNKVLLKHIDDVSQRLEDTETLVKELNSELKSIREELSQYKKKDIVSKPTQCARTYRDPKSDSNVEAFIKPLVRKQTQQATSTQTSRQNSNDNQRKETISQVAQSSHAAEQRFESDLHEEPLDIRYYQKTDVDDEDQCDDSRLDDEIHDELAELSNELLNRQPSTKESSTSSKKKQSQVLDQLD